MENRYTELDSLRGLIFLFVVIGHSLEFCPHTQAIRMKQILRNRLSF